jgi:hypothetical protein|tara:strand:- start:36 stop:878 length:843 start_codon:yes stop_codon:yes gene_type:complete
MSKVPAKTLARLKDEVPRYQRVLTDARSRDINEADTVVIVMDMLERVFGMDKYADITREYAIKGTYVDLAVKIEGRLEYLIEVKAIGLDLRDNHLHQAVTYAAKEGVRWVVLTNGLEWQIHRVFVDQQVTSDEVVSFNFTDLSMRKASDIDALFLLCKRGLAKDLMQDFFEKQQACNKFVIGALLRSDEVANLLRRTLRKMTPGIQVSTDEIVEVISESVLKREIIESEAGLSAEKAVKRFANRDARKKAKETHAQPSAASQPVEEQARTLPSFRPFGPE